MERKKSCRSWDTRETFCACMLEGGSGEKRLLIDRPQKISHPPSYGKILESSRAFKIRRRERRRESFHEKFPFLNSAVCRIIAISFDRTQHVTVELFARDGEKFEAKCADLKEEEKVSKVP